MKKLAILMTLIFLGVSSLPILAQVVTLSENEKTDIYHMLEEEKLARDVYIALGEKWDAQIFKNIAEAENRHFSAVKKVAEDYKLSMPFAVSFDETGKFENLKIQLLYNDLVKQGSESLLAALKVAAKFEELDIKDLNEATARTENQDLINLYTNLGAASGDHLRSFVKRIEKEGASYEPVILNQQEYDEILKATNTNSKAGCCSGKSDKSCKGKKGESGKACCGGKGKGKKGNCKSTSR